MAKLVQCDLCEKNIDEEDSYDLKLKKNSTKLTKTSDVCHDCCKEKGLLQILENRKWKKWNPKSFSWETPE